MLNNISVVIIVKDGGKTITQLLSEGTQKFGERLAITRAERFAA